MAIFSTFGSSYTFPKISLLLNLFFYKVSSYWSSLPQGVAQIDHPEFNSHTTIPQLYHKRCLLLPQWAFIFNNSTTVECSRLWLLINDCSWKFSTWQTYIAYHQLQTHVEIIVRHKQTKSGSTLWYFWSLCGTSKIDVPKPNRGNLWSSYLSSGTLHIPDVHVLDSDTFKVKVLFIMLSRCFCLICSVLWYWIVFWLVPWQRMWKNWLMMHFFHAVYAKRKKLCFAN